MEIKLAKMQDKDNILKLWKKNRKNLTIPFNSVVDSAIIEDRMYIAVENNAVIGMCSFKVMKIRPEIKLSNICVDEQYRNKGLGSNLMLKAIEATRELDLPYFLTARMGAENNIFYEKFCERECIVNRKSLDAIRYKVDVEKLKEKQDERK